MFPVSAPLPDGFRLPASVWPGDWQPEDRRPTPRCDQNFTGQWSNICVSLYSVLCLSSAYYFKIWAFTGMWAISVFVWLISWCLSQE